MSLWPFLVFLARGTHFGPYEILDLLGTGGMGEVYHARDSRLARDVALKILLTPHDASAIQLERFRREARSIARISHPHICAIHDVGEQAGVPFLVMEYLHGETLAERVERGAIAVELAAAYAIQIADALAALHENGIIHRDLKPSNIMVTASGVKLLDFGLAKLREADYTEPATTPTRSLALTLPGTMLGTLPYMAPEQIEGDDVDARTDIFAFGVVFYEMIAGRRPFAGDTRSALIAAIVGEEPPPLAALQPSVSRSLERLIRRCIAKSRTDRWQTARDLAAEIRGIMEPGAEASTPVRAPRRSAHRGWIAGALVAVSLAVGLIAGRTTAVSRLVSVAEYLPATYRRGVVSSARFAPDGRNLVYTASWDGQPYRVFFGGTVSGDARDLGLEGARVLSISRSGDMAVLFGRQNIQRVFGPRTLARIPLAGGARRDLLDGIVDADWIPGTDALAVIRDPGGNRPWLVEFPMGTPVHEARAAWSLRVSPDGNRIAFFEGPVLFDSAPEAMVTVIHRSGQKATLSKGWSGIGLAWTPSGNEVWFTATHGGAGDAPSSENRTGAPWLQAVSLSGVERTVHRAPDWLMLHDIASDGRVLVSRNSVRLEMSCQRSGESSERDLSWMYASLPAGISSTGETVIFQDVLGGRTASGLPTIFRRNLDGSAAIPLGEGNPRALSPDNKWVLAESRGTLILLPTGAGSSVLLPKGNLQLTVANGWLNDRTVVFTATGDDKQTRGYVQQIPDGAPRAITPAAVFLPVRAAVRDASSVLGVSQGRWSLYPVGGGDPIAVPALTTRDLPVQWSADGRFLYTLETLPAPVPSSRELFRVELSTGTRTLWKTLGPRDPVGVEGTGNSIAVASDGQSYCYSYLRRLGDLFIASGLQ